MDEDDDKSSLSSFISIGTAEVQPVPTPLPLPPLQRPHEQPELNTGTLHAPVATTAARTDHTLADLIDMHRLPPIEGPSPPPSPYSHDTMQHLTEHRSGSDNDPDHRRSILDPSTIKVSFTGFLSDISTTLPLEEGLQKLYDLYQETSPTTLRPLPLNLPITQLPLLTIANALTSHIQDLTTTLADSTANIDSLTHLNTRTKRDLNTLELQYCLARQEANMAHMSTDDLRLRLEWQKEEISRVNREKEIAIERARESDSLKEIVDALSGEVLAARKENERLVGVISAMEGRMGELEGEVEVGKGMLDRARFALRSVPGSVRWLCGKVLVPVSGRGEDRDRYDEFSDEDYEDEKERYRERVMDEKERGEGYDVGGGNEVLNEKVEDEGEWLGQGLSHGEGHGQDHGQDQAQDQDQYQHQGQPQPQPQPQPQKRSRRENWMNLIPGRERPLSRSFY